MRGLAEHGLRTALGSVGGEPPKGTAALLHPRGASAEGGSSTTAARCERLIVARSCLGGWI